MSGESVMVSKLNPRFPRYGASTALTIPDEQSRRPSSVIWRTPIGGHPPSFMALASPEFATLLGNYGGRDFDQIISV